MAERAAILRHGPIALRHARRIASTRSGETATTQIGRPKLLCRAAATAAQTRQPAAGQSEASVPFPPPSSSPSAIASRRESIKRAKPFSEFLTDNFHRQHDYLRISVTERCNLRCVYCMPEEGVPLSPPSHLLTSPEIFYLSSLFVSQGVTKIRLTGGEPTVRRDLVPLMQSIGSLRSNGLRELALTTNGITLSRKLESMVEAGLTGVNISLDTLDPWQYQIMTRRKGFENVMKSIDKVLELNKLGAGVKLKVNCVVMRGVNDREVVPFVELGREKDIEVRFIEYMPFDGNKWSQGKMLTYQEMLDMIRLKYPGLRKVKGHRNDTSKTYQIPGFVGSLGFITSMTQNFCGSCNRLRITSDGNLKVCLFGNSEVSLRDLLRKGNKGDPIDEEAFEALKEVEMNRQQEALSDQTPLGWGERERELLEVIGAAVKRKKERHAGMGELENMKNRPMILIDERMAATHPISNLRTPLNYLSHKPKLATGWPLSHLPFISLEIPSSAATSVRSFSSHARLENPTETWPLRIIERIENNGSLIEPQSDESAYESQLLTRLWTTLAEGEDTLRNARMVVFRLQNKRNLRKRLGKWLNSDLKSEETPLPVSKENVVTQNRAAAEFDMSSLYTAASEKTRQGPLREGSADGKPRLTHLKPSGEAHMVSITDKARSKRVAIATGRVSFSNPSPHQLIKANRIAKGDVLASARIAGIMAAKRCPDIIPLCHPITLTAVDVKVDLSEQAKADPNGAVDIEAKVECTGATGVEMEALTAVTGAALTVFDMCKAVDKRMAIHDVRVVYKAGGRSGEFVDAALRGKVESGKGSGGVRDEGSSPIRRQCYYCDQWFPNRRSLRDHQQQHHKELLKG